MAGSRVHLALGLQSVCFQMNSLRTELVPGTESDPLSLEICVKQSENKINEN